MMFCKLKKTPPAPRPFTVHVDKHREPLVAVGTKQEAFDAIEEYDALSPTVHHYTVVDGRQMRVAWQGVR